MRHAEFPRITDLTDRGRLYVGLIGGITTIVLTQKNNAGLVQELSASVQAIGKFTREELEMAINIGILKGNDIRNRFHAIKEQVNQLQ
ncbi:hypothetical protein KBD69_05060 [Candidatus Woesebacteria bacterium]|nr:hypothetical protein [Candidatus Woesebacteria bacterium]